MTAPDERRFALDGVGGGPGGSVADLDDRELMAGFGDARANSRGHTEMCTGGGTEPWSEG